MTHVRRTAAALLAGTALTMIVVPAAAQTAAPPPPTNAGTGQLPPVDPSANDQPGGAPGRSVQPGAQVDPSAGNAVTGDAAADQDQTLGGPDVVVTGIRASLADALEIKRQTIGVVDAISAEDIGEFPDANIAESLQRITGVSVDRVNGEGRGITVRGLGPEFNTVLLNNRLLSTEAGGRSFSFDILSSELITGAEVYKSSEARLQEGGIGSTVILRTARPTDRAGLHFAGSVAGRHDSTSDEVTPVASGVLSWSNQDRTFGVLASAIYDKRIFQLTNISTDGWIPDQNVDTNGDGVKDRRIAVPRTLNFTASNSRRERIGGTFAVDVVPSDTLKLELDALYTQQKVQSRTNQLGFYTDPDRITRATVNANNTATSFTVLPATATSGLAADNIVSTAPQNARTYQIGLNADWDVTDNLKLVFDAAHSNSRDNSDQVFYVVGTREVGVTPTFTLDGPGGLPIITNILPTNDKSAPRLHCCSERGYRYGDTINQGTVDATWKVDSGIIRKLQGGVLFTNRKKTTVVRESPEPLGCFYCGYLAVAPGSLFTDFSANVQGRDITWLDYNLNSLVQYYGTAQAVNQVGGTSQAAIDARNRFLAVYQGNNNSLDPIDRDRGSGTVRENTYAAYAQAEFGGNFGDSRWTAMAGARLIHTNVHATGYSVTLLNVIQNPADPTAAVPVYSPTVPVTADNKYTYILPTLNFRLDITDRLTARLAGSRTLTRPTLTRLGLSQDFVFRPPNSNTVSGGNPYLKPFLAWNADASVDYYLSRTSYASLAGFYKKLENFIISGQQPETYFGLNFIANRPYNAQKGDVYGFEAAIQTTFDFLPAPFDGFGGSANYTLVKSSIRFDPSLSNQTFNVEGLSDTANVVLFYEKGRVQVRGAYNWRAPFLRQTFGPQSQPENIFSYDQIDLSGSLKINDNLAVFGEVLNLTDAKFKSYSRFKERLITVSDQGRRISLGVRANF